MFVFEHTDMINVPLLCSNVNQTSFIVGPNIKIICKTTRVPKWLADKTYMYCLETWRVMIHAVYCILTKPNTACDFKYKYFSLALPKKC